MLRVTDRRLRARLDEILELNFADDVLAWSLEPDGTWVEGSRRARASRRRSRSRSSRSRARRRAASTADRGRSPRACASPTSFGMALASSVARLDANEPALWTERDPEAVHQARVATRRLRSDLRTLHDFVDAALGAAPARRAALARRRARRGPRHRGAARATRARTRRCSPTPRPTRRARAIRRLDADRRRGAHRSAASRCASRATRSCTARCTTPSTDAAAHRRAPTRARSTRCPARCGRRGAGCARAVDELGAVPSDAALHEVRIRAKRCRYAAELASPVIGRPARRARRARSTRVQDVLGEHQDAVVADAWLAKTAPECSPAEAYALGMLAEIERGAGRARPGPRSPARGTPRRRRSLRGLAVSGPRPRPRRGRRRDTRPRPTAADRGARRAPAALRRLEPAQGQARARRAATRTRPRREVEEETGLPVRAG